MTAILLALALLGSPLPPDAGDVQPRVYLPAVQVQQTGQSGRIPIQSVTPR